MAEVPFKGVPLGGRLTDCVYVELIFGGGDWCEGRLEGLLEWPTLLREADSGPASRADDTIRARGSDL